MECKYELKGDDLSSNIGVLSTENGYLDFEGDDIVDVPASVFNDIDSAITISFWCYGDPELMPFNSYILKEGTSMDIESLIVICHGAIVEFIGMQVIMEHHLMTG